MVLSRRQGRDRPGAQQGLDAGHPWREGSEDVQAERVLQSTCKCPQRTWQIRRARGKAESWEGAPGHSNPPSHIRACDSHERARQSHHSQRAARGRKSMRGARLCYFNSFQDPAASGKTKSSSWYSRLKRVSEKTVSFMLILARPPLLHRTGWPDM